MSSGLKYVLVFTHDMFYDRWEQPIFPINIFFQTVMANTFSSGSTSRVVNSIITLSKVQLDDLATTSSIVPQLTYRVGDALYRGLTTSQYVLLSEATPAPKGYISLLENRFGWNDDGRDMTDAIYQAILAASASSGPGAIYIPPCTTTAIPICGSLDLTSVRRVRIYGANSGGWGNYTATRRSALKLKANIGTNDMFVFGGGTAFGTTGSENVIISGLYLDGNSANQSSGTQNAIYIPGQTDGAGGGIDTFHEITNNFINKFTGTGVLQDIAADNGSCRASRIIDNKIYQCGRGIWQKASDGWIERNDVGSCTNEGILVGNATQRILFNNVFGNNIGIKLQFGSATLNVVQGNAVDRNGTVGMEVGGRGTTVTGNIFHKNSMNSSGTYAHMSITTSGVLVNGNTFRRDFSTDTPTLASFDIYINDTDPTDSNNPIVADIGINYSHGRGFSNANGHIGKGSAASSRVRRGSGAAEMPMITNPEFTVASGTATTATLGARDLFNAVIYHTGTPAAGVTVTTATASAMMNTMMDAATAGSAKSSFIVRWINQTGQIVTIVGGSGVTMSGTNTIGVGKWRDFIFTGTNSSTVTLKNAGSGDA